MKLAILNREPSAYPGGDMLSAYDLRNALAPFGVEATCMKGQWTPTDLQPFDLVYIKHVNFTWSWFNITQTWQAGKPYVLQPMFYPTFELGNSREQVYEALARADAIHVNSLTELRTLEIMGIQVRPDPKHLSIIPNGTSIAFHHSNHPHGGPRDEVLTVSARKDDNNKKVDRVVEACKCAKVPLTTVVESRPLSHMPNFYFGARVFVNASDSERCSRTVAEALCAGCRVLSTKHNWGNEWYPGVQEIDPDTDFAPQIVQAYHAAKWDYTPNEAARKWTWERVAHQLKEVFEQCLKEKNYESRTS